LALRQGRQGFNYVCFLNSLFLHNSIILELLKLWRLHELSYMSQYRHNR
jgi:hypothetical protein